MESIIKILDIINLLQGVAYVWVIYCVTAVFIPLRKHWLFKLLAFLCLYVLAPVVIFLDDPWNISLALIGFIVHIFAFYSGKWEKKTTAILIFYPMLIAVNFLHQNLFSDLFFSVSNAPSPIHDENGVLVNWSLQTQLLSSAIWTLSNVVRLLFWIGVLFFLRRHRQQTAADNIERKSWLIADALMLIPVIAIVTTVLFVTQANYIVYPLCLAIILGGIAELCLIAYMNKAEQAAREAQRLERQYAYYEEKRKSEEKVRALYHDMKNHLLLLESQDSPETRQMASQLRQQISEYEDYVRTGNDFLDIIVRDKAKQAKENQIDFSAVIHFEKGEFLKPMDISTIFGNALDNALEASLELPPEQRLITVKADCVRELLSIVVENNCAPDKGGYRQTSKKDIFLHGFGIRNIRNAVEKYSGQCLIRQEKGCFQMKILLPLP